MTNIPITTEITDATPENQIHREMRKSRVLLIFRSLGCGRLTNVVNGEEPME